MNHPFHACMIGVQLFGSTEGYDADVDLLRVETVDVDSVSTDESPPSVSIHEPLTSLRRA